MSEASEGKVGRVVAVDRGGTFSDVRVVEGGRLRSLKIPSPQSTLPKPFWRGSWLCSISREETTRSARN